jgi:hypothetical protein
MRFQELANNEAEGFAFRDPLAPRKHVLDLGALVDDPPARALPAHKTACLSREITLGEDVVRDVRQALTLDVR